jgi:hypothetical protein
MSVRSADVEWIGKASPCIELALVLLGERRLDKRADAEDVADTVFVRGWSGQAEWKSTWSDHTEPPSPRG